MLEIKEADWKVLRRLHPLALDRFCQRVLEQLARTATDASKGSHERYLELYNLIKAQDREMAQTFDELKRSNAFRLIAAMQRRKLLTEEEFAGFSQETRNTISLLLGD